jgi:acetyl esterase/lipase
MNRVLIASLFLFFLKPVLSQTLLPLWPGGVPDCAVDSPYREEVRDIGRVTMAVQQPTLEVFLPPSYRNSGAGVLICPGGGYYLQAYDWEGTDMARWLNSVGIAAFVLKYRLPYWSKPGCSEHIALDDARRAMQMIRSQAATYKIDPAKIGVMGFSAGGHLAASLSVHYEGGMPASTDPVGRVSSRPDFSILVYPVISLDTTVSHGGSRKNLLGPNPKPELISRFSCELQVNENTPPAILIHASDDTGVPVENSIRYYQALIKHKRPAALYIYPEGGHGFAIAHGKGFISTWTKQVEGWLQHMGFIKGN